jgi:hypothetical protein
MRPEKRVPKADADMFRARLDQMINPHHELLKQAALIDWVERSCKSPAGGSSIIDG